MPVNAVRLSPSDWNIPNPKRGARECARSAWFPYYAGFSGDFVRSVVSNFQLAPGSLVLDPWNGAGTTTQIAYDLGLNVVGFDINRVMAMVARSRLVTKQQIPELRTKAKAIVALAKASRRDPPTGDLLNQWFKSPAVGAIRAVTRAIEDVCEVSFAPAASLPDETASFFVVALFSAVRALSGKAKCSNPTWTLNIEDGRSRIGFVRPHLMEAYSRTIDAFLNAFSEEKSAHVYSGPVSVRIEPADSRLVPLDDGIIDLIVTSPPYCTRIDYSVTTSIERALIYGNHAVDTEVERNDFMGTSTIRKNAFFEDCEIFDGYVLDVVRAIESHSSYASRSYYAKTYRQYFFDLVHSLGEIARVLKKSGVAVLVVQDSYYKDLRVDLARACRAILDSHGFYCLKQADFPVMSDIAEINTRSKKYRNSSLHTESVVVVTRK